jgi:predicted DCC family thiol-disulfide oxidoreductase YuxK
MEGNNLILIYDDDCKICSRFKRFLVRVDGKRHIIYLGLNSDAGKLNSIPELVLYDRETLRSAVHVLVNGKVHSGWDAILALADAVMPFRFPVVLGRLPILYPAGKFLYRRVASNRYLFGKCRSGICE